MSYQNGKKILPETLLAAIQQYVDGAYVYIPRRQEQRYARENDHENRQQLLRRNQEIFLSYQAGKSVQELTQCYFLSDKTIYKIIAEMKQ